MRSLDVKEIHGYHAAHGLKLLEADVLAARKKDGQGFRICRRRRRNHGDDPWACAMYRVIETGSGIGVAMLLTLVPRLIQIEGHEAVGSPEPADRRTTHD